MMSSVVGLLGLLGATTWLVKVLLIWQNGGTNTTDGMIGTLFVVGGVCLSITAAATAWRLSSGARPARRLGAVVLSQVVLTAMVDLPIGVGWLLLGHTWLAGEVGIILTALAAAVLGVHQMKSGRRSTEVAPTDLEHQR